MNKCLIGVFVFLGSHFSWGSEPNCQLVRQEGVQKHFRCRHPESQQHFHLLDITGDFRKVSYFHGKFLAAEIESEVLKGIKLAETRAFNDLEPSERKTLRALQKCVLGRYEHASSFDFQDGLRALAKGMRDGGSSAEKSDIKEAHYLVEFSIFTDALRRGMEENPKKIKNMIALNCGPQMVIGNLTNTMRSFFKGLQKLKMGCTGIVANGFSTQKGSLLHARNFDTGLLGYIEKEPVVQIQRFPNGRYVVGMAAAGMPYAGGITGFNSDGLSGSLHELQTRHVRIYAEQYSTDIAPYLLHKVLSEARNLDEGIQLIQKIKGFGAWTFLLADAKSNEVASIEMSADKVVVARRVQNSDMAQSNHFLAPETRAVGFEYSANKTLESVSRFNFISRELNSSVGSIDAQWMMDHLSGHWDEFIGIRSFGRTTTKVYTALSHVLDAKNQELWLTLADRYPTNRSPFVGLKLQLDQKLPVQFIGSYRAQENLLSQSWYDSLEYYVKAWMHFEHASRRSLPAVDAAIEELRKAQSLALESGVQEYAYHFMEARFLIHKAALLLEQIKNQEAFVILFEAEAKLSRIKSFSNLHDFEKGQLIYWNERIADLRRQMGQTSEINLTLLKDGKTYFDGLFAQYPYQNLFSKMGRYLERSIPYKELISESPELVTVE